MAREKLIIGKDIVVHGSVVPAEAYPITVFAPTVPEAKEMMLPLTDSGVTVAFQRSRRTRTEWVWYEHDPNVEAAEGRT